MRRYRLAQTNKAAGRQVYFLLCASLHDSKSDRGVSSWISSNCPSSISRKSTSWNIEIHWNTHPASSSCFGPSKILVHLSRLTGEARTWFGLPFVQGSSGRSKASSVFSSALSARLKHCRQNNQETWGGFQGAQPFPLCICAKNGRADWAKIELHTFQISGNLSPRIWLRLHRRPSTTIVFIGDLPSFLMQVLPHNLDSWHSHLLHP